MKKTIGIFAIVFVLTIAAFADVAIDDRQPKKPAKHVDTTLHISIDHDAKEARLIIPKKQLRQLRAELDALDNGNDNTAAAFFDVSQTQTIVSGILLSLAFVVGGVWFARSGSRPKKTAAMVFVGGFLAASGAFATYVYANAGPPAEARSITGKIFSQPVHVYKFATGPVKLETTTSNDRIVLIVPEGDSKPAGE